MKLLWDQEKMSLWINWNYWMLREANQWKRVCVTLVNAVSFRLSQIFLVKQASTEIKNGKRHRLCRIWMQNDRWFPEKYVIKDHAGCFGGKHTYDLCFGYLQDQNWTRRLNRKNFKVNERTKACSEIILKTLLLRKSFWIKIHGFSIIAFQQVGFNIGHRRIREILTSCRPVCQSISKRKGDSID